MVGGKVNMQVGISSCEAVPLEVVAFIVMAFLVVAGFAFIGGLFIGQSNPK